MDMNSPQDVFRDDSHVGHLVDSGSFPFLPLERDDSALLTGPRLEPIGLDNTSPNTNTQRSVTGQETLYVTRTSFSGSSGAPSRDSASGDISSDNDDAVSHETPPDGREAETANQNLTQYPIPDNSPLSKDRRSTDLTQHSLQSTRDYACDSLQEAAGAHFRPSRRSTFELVVQSRLSDCDLSDSHCTDTKSSLTQYLLDDSFLKSLRERPKSLNTQTFSELALSGLSEQNQGQYTEVYSKEPTMASSGESSDPIAMFSTRPGTAIEQGALSANDEASSTKRSKLDDYLLASEKDTAIDKQHQVLGRNSPMTPEMESMNLASSIKFQHKHHESNLGETLLDNTKDPILASTPSTQKGKFQDLARELGLPQMDIDTTGGSWSKGDSNDEGSVSHTAQNGDHAAIEQFTFNQSPGSEASSRVVQTEENAASSAVFYPLQNLTDSSYSQSHSGYADGHQLTEQSLHEAVAAVVRDALPLEAEPAESLLEENNEIDRASHHSSASAGARSAASGRPSSSPPAIDNPPSRNSQHSDDNRSRSSTGARSVHDEPPVPDRPTDDILAQFETSDDPELGRIAMWTAMNNGVPVSTGAAETDRVSESSKASDQGDNSLFKGSVASHSSNRDDHHSSQRDDVERSNQDGALSHGFKSEGSLSEKVAAILANAPLESVASDTEYQSRQFNPGVNDAGIRTQPAVDSEEEDIQRITSEYRTVLKDRLADFTDSEPNVSGIGSNRPQNDSVFSTGSQQNSTQNVSHHLAEPDTVTIVKTVSEGKSQYAVSQNGESKPSSRMSGSDTDDSLDKDVRKILAKYGRSLSDSEDDVASKGRSSPAGSVSESENISGRVKRLLYGKPSELSHRSNDTGSLLNTTDKLPAYMLDDPAQSMSLPMDLHSSVVSQDSVHAALPTVHKASEKSALDGGAFQDFTAKKPVESLLPPERTAAKRFSAGQSVSSEDTITGKMKKLLTATEYVVEQKPEADQSSKHSSRTTSLAGSVDLENLEKDLDEMEVEMESLKKSSEAGSRRDSQASQSSAASSYHASRGSLDAARQGSTLKNSSQINSSKSSRESEGSYGFLPFAQGRESNLSDKQLDSMHTSSSNYTNGSYQQDQSNLDHRNMHGSNDEKIEEMRSSARPYKTDLGTHALLTSGVVPMDIALDIVHGYGYSANHNRSRESEHFGALQPSVSFPDRSHGQQGDRFRRSQQDMAYSDRDVDTELGKYTTASFDTSDQSYSEKVIGIVERDSPTRQAYEYLSEANRPKPRTTVGVDLSHLKRREDPAELNQRHSQVGNSKTPEAKTPGQSFNTTPVSHTPFSVLGNFKSVFTSQMDKVTASSFDKSIELRTPYRRGLEETSRSRERPEDLVTIEHDPGTNRYAVPAYDRSAASGARHSSSLRESTKSAHATELITRSSRSPVESGVSSRTKDNTTFRSNSPSLHAANLRPYKPAGSQDVYYVESGTEDGISTVTASETTVESTHIGSDDARGPVLPASALGSRPDSSTSSEGIYHKKKGPADTLSAIQEHPSVDSRDTDSAKSRTRDTDSAKSRSRDTDSAKSRSRDTDSAKSRSRDTDSAKSRSEDSQRSRKEEEQERSLRKAQDWVDGMGGDGTPRDPNEKETPRDGPSSEVEALKLLDEIQPQDAIGDKEGTRYGARVATGSRASGREEKAYATSSQEKGVYSSSEAYPKGTRQAWTEDPQRYDERLSDSQYRSPGFSMEFGTPQKAQLDRSRSKTRDSWQQSQERPEKISDIHATVDTSSPFFSNSKFSARYPPSSIKLSDESISPVLPQRERLHRSILDPATSTLDYDKIRRPPLEDSYDVANSRVDYGRHSDLKLRNVSFSPLRPEQDTDELLEPDYTQDVPGKSYPPTPHPHSGRRSLGQDAETSSPSRYTGRSSGASPGTDQSILSDQMARFEDKTRFNAMNIRSPGYKPGSRKVDQSPQSWASVGTSPTKPRSRSAGSPKSRTNGSLMSRSPSPRSRRGRMQSWSPLRWTGSTSNTFQTSVQTSDLSSVNGSPHMKSPSSRVRELSPSRFRNYDEERLQQRMRYIMERMSPGLSARPSEINTAWEQFIESRHQSRSDNSTMDMTTELSEKVARLLEKSSETSQPPSSPEIDRPMRSYQLNQNRKADTFDRAEQLEMVDTQEQAKRPKIDAAQNEKVDNIRHNRKTMDITKKTKPSVPAESAKSRQPIPHIPTTITRINSPPPPIPMPPSSVLTVSTTQSVSGTMQTSTAATGSRTTRSTAAPVVSATAVTSSTSLTRTTDSVQRSVPSRKSPISPTVDEEKNKRSSPHVPAERTTVAPQPVPKLSQQVEDIFNSNAGPSIKPGPMTQNSAPVAQPQHENVQHPLEENDNDSTLVNTTDFSPSVPLPQDQNTKSDSSTLSDTETEPKSFERIIPLQNVSGNHNLASSTAKKTAYLIQDESLPSVPEDSTLESISSDFTTSSCYESDGKVIMKTTKRHLPADPSLLRLQHKIFKQKEKFRHDRLREIKRKEKIAQLERVLAERMISSSHLSSPHQRKLPTPKKSRSCTCQHVSQSATELGTRPQQPAWSKSMSPEHVKSQSDHHVEAEKPVRVTRPSGASYLEFEKPPSKRSHRAKSKSPARSQQAKESESNSKVTYHKETKDEQNLNARDREKSSSERRKKEKQSENNRRDFGQTCPTPISRSPARQVNKQPLESVTMVSQSVQTHSFVEDGRKAKENRPIASKLRESEARGMFSPDGSLLSTVGDSTIDTSQDVPRDLPRKQPRQKISCSAGQSGLSWFIPVENAKPQREPLRERQPQTITMDTWSALDSHVSANLRELEHGINRYMDSSQKSVTANNRTNTGKGAMTLQEAFESHMRDFVSHSRERQRLVNLRAEERRIQDLHDAERERLFAVKRKMEPNLHALPISDLHFKPQRRKFTMKQMRKQTAKKYKKLPEVVQKVASQKKVDDRSVNRLRARLYKKKIQDQILGRRSGYY